MKKFIFNINPKSLRRLKVDAGKSMFSLKDTKVFLSIFSKYGARLVSILFGRVKVASRVKGLHNFFQFLFKMNRNHGTTYTIMWLKASSVALQRFLAGSPYKSLRDSDPSLPLPRLYNGIPFIIGSQDRRSIRNGNVKVIRYWLTLFNLYRIIEGPLKPKLNTITDPYTGQQEILESFDEFVRIHMKRLLGEFKPNFRKSISASYIVRSRSASTNFGIAMSSTLSDLCWIAQDEGTYNVFKQYAIASKSYPLFKKLDNYIEFLYNALHKGARIPVKGNMAHSAKESGMDVLTKQLPSKREINFASPQDVSLKGGQLSLKVEAAGKLRVFAIADVWTQSFLKPLHEYLFSLLSKLPNDGTFDQDASVERSLEKSLRRGKAFSVDLSSATDRLPIALQQSVLTYLFSPELAKAWRDLLVEREYRLNSSELTDKYPDLKPGEYKYSVGQPMGALSSWAMLAFTHHLLVQFAVFRCKGKQELWYNLYEVLGDDIVLFEEDVYREYLTILDLLGVGANPAKSIPAPTLPAFEFAKRTGLSGEDVSGLSWKEFLQGDSLPGKINLILRLGKRRFQLNTTAVAACLARGPHDIAKPLKAGAHHALLGILGSLLGNESKTLLYATSVLIDPHNEEDELEPKKATIPLHQTMQSVVKMLNGDDHTCMEDVFSLWEDRVDICKSELIPYMSETAYLNALSYTKKIVQTYDSLIDEFAETLLDLSLTGDNLLVAQRRGIAEDILLRDTDPQDRLDALEVRLHKAAKYGMPIKEAIELYKDSISYMKSFHIDEPSRGAIPTDNWLILLAAKAGTCIGGYWKVLKPFDGYKYPFNSSNSTCDLPHLPSSNDLGAGSNTGSVSSALSATIGETVRSSDHRVDYSIRVSLDALIKEDKKDNDDIDASSQGSTKPR